MLVVHPNSTCDVCLEGYGSGEKLPHAISCGHVFCQSCLESLTRHQCPLCRTRFQSEDIMRLHIDQGNSPRMRVPRRSFSDPGPSEGSDEARRFQDSITRIVLEGAPASQLRTLIDECHTWLKTQPSSQHGDLRASFLLVYNLTETQRKYAAETQALNEAKGQCEDLRTQITSEREEAERKYQELVRSSADERETAFAVEKSLRQHYEQLDTEWRGKYDVAVEECRALNSQLNRYRLGLNPLSEMSRSVEVRYFQVESDRHPIIPEDRLTAKDDIRDLKSDVKATLEPSKEDMFHLSPLPSNIPPLPSAIMGFAPLADDEDDLKKQRDASDQKPIPYPLGRSIDPIPISSSAPRMSGLSMTIQKGHDLGSSGLSRSLPRGYDVPVNSRPPTPPGRASSAVPQFTQGPTVPQELRRNKDHHSHPLSREYERSDPVDQRDRWRAKLYDILDSPSTTPSPPSSFKQQSPMEMARPRSDSRAPSRMASASHLAISANSKSSTSDSGTQPTNAVLSQPSNSSNLTATHRSDVHRPVLISHASSAAMALERERQRAERERQQTQGPPSSTRDKDAYPKKHYGYDVLGNKNGKGKLSIVTTNGLYV